ncbi:septum formation initiator family protein [Mycolicibacterium flavescens]|uniref:Septum formation initiator n=1 Tax=Mycolicibacterium flavescens TaxID=1776 RepID=A0A1E3REI6_MYCFV|nr:septum formation initiator family protein [Mycolicibacterium flavescens]MCV7282629.1 septum formation initiator family protein [Mycolicibacterium flavescens]ODQ88249.1 septum formation initiator [Mycolicibacterium flavescens]
MPEAKRPDPRRRSPTSRPGKSGSGGAGKGRPRTGARREPRPAEVRADAEDTTADDAGIVIRRSIAESAELQSEQRFGSAARRAAILAAVVCVLTLTIAGPVRTYFAQRTEMRQLKATEEQLRAQIAELEQQKGKLADPVFIAAQARERLGFVMPGEIPYQVQLPPEAVVPTDPDQTPTTTDPAQPWYTALWHTIADEPHGISPVPPVPDTVAPGPLSPQPPPPPGG